MVSKEQTGAKVVSETLELVEALPEVGPWDEGQAETLPEPEPLAAEKSLEHSKEA